MGCWLKSWVPDESQWGDEDGVTSGLRSSAPPSLASALQSAPYCAKARVGKNSHGTNLKQASWSNVAEDCCNQCNGDSACHAWTWIEGSHECWLKSWVSDESQGADAAIHVFWRCRQEQPWDEPEAGCLVQRRGGLLQAVQRGLGVPRLDLDRGEPRVLAEVLGP